ncbi:phenylalanyl-tRNA synthetase [Haematococcus lacustris]
MRRLLPLLLDVARQGERSLQLVPQHLSSSDCFPIAKPRFSRLSVPSHCDLAQQLHTSRATSMPTVSVSRDLLFQKLGRSYTDVEFEDLCFEYGIELDDVTTEKEMTRKELNKGTAEVQGASEEVLYKIDIPANRYDMLCVEGIARALNIFKDASAAPKYRLADMTGRTMLRMVVKPETVMVRPFVVCAVLRGVTFDPARYASFIDLQDKLHQNLCRQRSLVAIGTHDLQTLQAPFTYEALPPDEIVFVPLKQTREFKASELLQHYLDNDLKLRKFVPIIKDSVVYPVLYDAKRTVLSLPPIINGAHSAIKLSTRDVLIECTATDLTKAKVVLNTVVCMFSEYCSNSFEVEPVEVQDAAGDISVFPCLESRSLQVPVSYINANLGLDLPAPEVASLLQRMQLNASVEAGQAAGEPLLQLHVPPTRSDILHAIDVVEDVAIAYGYNNIPKMIPSTYTQGLELPINQLVELVRAECAMAGYTEVLTWALCSKAENSEHLRRGCSPPGSVVEIGNPATAEFEVCRSTLLAAALKTLGANKDAALPIKLFEASDVILVDTSRAVGARNERRLVAVYCNKEANFEMVHGLLNRVMEVLGVPLAGAGEVGLEAKYGGSYCLQPGEDPVFFPGRQAQVLAKGTQVGSFGVVHPEVLEKFDIPFPVSALELNLEPFCFDQFYRPLVTQAAACD